jgi:hypothetical protein
MSYNLQHQSAIAACDPFQLYVPAYGWDGEPDKKNYSAYIELEGITIHTPTLTDFSFNGTHSPCKVRLKKDLNILKISEAHLLNQ